MSINESLGRRSRVLFLPVLLVLGRALADDSTCGDSATGPLAFAAAPTADEPVMHAHFIDVGQANATLLAFPCGAVLIDAGAQDKAHADKLIEYLDAFFTTHGSLNKTLKAVYVTHNHIDHTYALSRVAEHFSIEHYIDGGQMTESGKAGPLALRAHPVANGDPVHLRAVEESESEALPAKTGLTDNDIDPVQCADCDPKIVALASTRKENPGWTDKEFDNLNNHILVLRVDFGQASFLFTGDLEEPAIESLLGFYDGTDRLDVDVYELGHHGSNNGTTSELLEALTPQIAVISCGKWDFGKTPPKAFSTFAYGNRERLSSGSFSSQSPANVARPPMRWSRTAPRTSTR